MKTLIPILIGLLVVGCGKKQSTNTNENSNIPAKTVNDSLEDKIIGTYKDLGIDDRLILRKGGIVEFLEGGKKDGEGTWAIKNGEIYVVHQEKENGYLKLDDEGNLTLVAIEEKSKRRELPTDEPLTLIKLAEGITKEDVAGVYDHYIGGYTERLRLILYKTGKAEMHSFLKEELPDGVRWVEDYHLGFDLKWTVKDSEVKVEGTENTEKIKFLVVGVNGDLTAVRGFNKETKKSYNEDDRDLYKKLKGEPLKPPTNSLPSKGGPAGGETKGSSK